MDGGWGESGGWAGWRRHSHSCCSLKEGEKGTGNGESSGGGGLGASSQLLPDEGEADWGVGVLRLLEGA